MTMRTEVRWERMFVDQIEAAFAACPVAYLPSGLCEPHGPQNALGCDGLRAHAFTRRAAELHGGNILVTSKVGVGSTFRARIKALPVAAGV